MFLHANSVQPSSICCALITCICICKLGLGCAKCCSKYGWTSESEPHHSHIPTFVKCKKQWEVGFASRYHKNTTWKLALCPLYGKWSESRALKEKWPTYWETWIMSHISTPCSAHQRPCWGLSVVFIFPQDFQMKGANIPNIIINWIA